MQALQTDPTAALAAHGIVDDEATATLAIFNLMSVGAESQQEVNRKSQAQLQAAQEDTLAVAKQMKLGLQKTLEQIDKAYRSTMLMYQITFYLGVALIVAATGIAIVGQAPLLPAIFGTLGMADILAFFLFKPQERLQASRSSLAQVQAALYNWFMDSVNLNSMMALYGQSRDYAGAERMSKSLLSHTEKTLDMLQKYCKLADV
ncbi:MAG: hypothetical protein IT469_12625 [Pseudomonadales bacterium]|nr:hypothetical protein [Pseudomonadales bacterium]